MWSCAQCRRNRDLHRARGQCGDLFDLALPGAELGADGHVEISGREINSGARGSFGSSIWRTCPVALAGDSEVRAVFDVFARQRDGRLLEAPKLTRAGAAALDMAARAESALRAAQTRRLDIVRNRT